MIFFLWIFYEEKHCLFFVFIIIISFLPALEINLSFFPLNGTRKQKKEKWILK